MKNRLIRGIAVAMILISFPLVNLAEETVPGESLRAVYEKEY